MKSVSLFSVLGILVALAALACGSSQPTDTAPPAKATSRATRASVSPTSDPKSPIATQAVWDDRKAQDRINQTCFVAANKDKNSQKFCIQQLMQGAGASSQAIAFFDANGFWLIRLFDSPTNVKAGFVLQPGSSNPVPQLAFMAGQTGFKPEVDLRSEALPAPTDNPAKPFENDPMFPALLNAAKRRFLNADDPLKLMHFDTTELESTSILSRGVQEFVVQVGIHNFCNACGIGVAVRYAFDFDVASDFSGARLLGLCQGRSVTQNIEGFGRVTVHDFSGIAAGKTGVSEPYLLTVPGLSTCPEHLPG